MLSLIHISLVDNPDIYFQLREANNTDYANLPDVVEDYMAQISRLTGREYHPVSYTHLGGRPGQGQHHHLRNGGVL